MSTIIGKWMFDFLCEIQPFWSNLSVEKFRFDAFLTTEMSQDFEFCLNLKGKIPSWTNSKGQKLLILVLLRSKVGNFAILAKIWV